MKAIAPHIHTPDDGRGQRKVFVDGKEVDYCVMADVNRGIAVFWTYPFRLNPWTKRPLTYTLRGTVKVEQL